MSLQRRISSLFYKEYAFVGTITSDEFMLVLQTSSSAMNCAVLYILTLSVSIIDENMNERVNC